MLKAAVTALGAAIVLAQIVAAADAPQGPAAKASPVKAAEVVKAEAARKKPLRRCDELADKAQTECLQKAREQIVEARKKREASAKGDAKSVGKRDVGEGPTPKQEILPKATKTQ